jgi:hypothetical protein
VTNALSDGPDPEQRSEELLQGALARDIGCLDAWQFFTYALTGIDWTKLERPAPPLFHLRRAVLG